ncbi:MAG: hypothetical protein A2984_03035 [Omnitrophica WOR_2 bacterium RIFCSPLOWO2_01_FULL_41_12]|nr:MAG: hypothetical protein A2984_03035 [Omnitrophica WOR_2 bacterium RIFCSPLOWO2_01_FULL_41_12]
MFSAKAFQITLLISVIAHGIILFQNSNLSLFSKDNKEQDIEVRYLKNDQKPEEKPKTTNLKKEPLLKLPAKITENKRTPPPFVNKEAGLPESIFTKPTLIRPDIISIKKKITLPPVDMDKINNPSYISYYQIVREKIRRAAYQNYTRTETGEAYLSFIVSSEGDLKTVRLVQEKSSKSPYLQEIALRSIKDASPFPIFPKELDYPQLSFNVVISFQIE